MQTSIEPQLHITEYDDRGRWTYGSRPPMCYLHRNSFPIFANEREGRARPMLLYVYMGCGRTRQVIVGSDEMRLSDPYQRILVSVTVTRRDDMTGASANCEEDGEMEFKDPYKNAAARGGLNTLQAASLTYESCAPSSCCIHALGFWRQSSCLRSPVR